MDPLTAFPLTANPRIVLHAVDVLLYMYKPICNHNDFTELQLTYTLDFIPSFAFPLHLS